MRTDFEVLEMKGFKVEFEVLEKSKCRKILENFLKFVSEEEYKPCFFIFIIGKAWIFSLDFPLVNHCWKSRSQLWSYKTNEILCNVGTCNLLWC